MRETRGPLRPAGRTRRRATSLAAALALAGLGAGCDPALDFFPPLAGSAPAPGATDVARSAWLELRFAADVPVGAKDLVVLVCDGVPLDLTTHLAAPDLLVVNPVGSLPAGADCVVGFTSVSGDELLDFSTAPAAAPFTALYDRRDRNTPLPFPDDFFLAPDSSSATGLRPEIVVPDRTVTVRNLLGSMALTASELDGWSPIGNLSVQLSAAPDPATLPLDPEASLDPLATVGLFDLTPGSDTWGERIPFQLTIRSDTIAGRPTVHALVIFPGIPLAPAGRYALAVTNRVLSLDGEPLSRSSFFAEALGPITPGADGPLLRARALAREVARALEATAPLPIPRDDLALAVRVSVRSTDDLPSDVLAVRAQAFAAPPSFTVTDVEEVAFGDVAAFVRGTFESPNWMFGLGPFVQRDGSGLPVPADGKLQIPFILALPRAAETGHAPLVMYQHGNPGSAQNEVPGAADFLAPEGLAVAGFTDPLNRFFATVDDQTTGIFGVLLATGDVAEFWLQTYGEQFAFLHVLQSLGSLDVLPFGAPDGVPDLDPSTLCYEGISQGSNHGQAFLAYAPEIDAAGLVVGATRLAEILEYQDRTLPLGGVPFFTQLLPPYVEGVTMPDIWMGLSLFQLLFDAQDPHNHAAFLYRDPVEVDGTARKASILALEGIGDSFIPSNATRSLAWTLGPIPHLAPTIVPVSYLPVANAPIQGNVDAETSAAFVQFAPSGIPGIPPSPGCSGFFYETEGHYCAQTAPEARELRASFYRSAVDGVPVIDR